MSDGRHECDVGHVQTTRGARAGGDVGEMARASILQNRRLLLFLHKATEGQTEGRLVITGRLECFPVLIGSELDDERAVGRVVPQQAGAGELERIVGLTLGQ